MTAFVERAEECVAHNDLARSGGAHQAGLRAHVRKSLAGYKTPKRVVLADRSLRASNGKADYPAAKAIAAAAI